MTANNNDTIGDEITDIHPKGSSNDTIYVEPPPERQLSRPPARLLRTIFLLLIFLSVVFVAGISTVFFSKPLLPRDFPISAELIGVIVAALLFSLGNFLFLKKFLIRLVLIYQHFAPDRVRKRCLFTPSCSEYMILSLQKYGVVRGLIKGIDRLFRCHSPNGGKDEP